MGSKAAKVCQSSRFLEKTRFRRGQVLQSRQQAFEDPRVEICLLLNQSGWRLVIQPESENSFRSSSWSSKTARTSPKMALTSGCSVTAPSAVNWGSTTRWMRAEEGWCFLIGRDKNERSATQFISTLIGRLHEKLNGGGLQVCLDIDSARAWSWN